MEIPRNCRTSPNIEVGNGKGDNIDEEKRRREEHPDPDFLPKTNMHLYSFIVLMETGKKHLFHL